MAQSGAMDQDAATIPLLAGLRDIAAAYDGFILDVWGVLHDGQRPYPGVVDALARLRAAGKRVVVLSNAPRRAAAVVRRLTEIGIAPDSYDAAMTSGEDVWDHLRLRGRAEAAPFYRALGPRCFHLGPDWDHGLFDALPIEIVPAVGQADFVLTTGVHDRGATLEQYEAVLQEIAARRLPMICANPDLVVMHAGRLEYCAGSLAQRYEALGGEVVYHGKPHPGVYAKTLKLLGGVDPRRVLAVGDSLRTDMAGAAAAGIDGLLVLGGIHFEEFSAGGRPDPARIGAACLQAGLAPCGVVSEFAW